MINTIAIDDEPIALDILRQHAGIVPFIKLLKTFESASEATTFMKENAVQLVFLDIQMPGINGVEFAEKLSNNISVIFTTAYSQYAVKGFELAAADYLLKPINFNRFLGACQRVYDKGESNKKDRPCFFVKDGYEQIRVVFDDLVLAEANGNYVTLFENHRKTVARITLTALLQRLPAGKFVRISKSVIVAVDRIEKIANNHIIIGDRNLRMSENYCQHFSKTISN